jgi:hypothetical protein
MLKTSEGGKQAHYSLDFWKRRPAPCDPSRLPGPAFVAENIPPSPHNYKVFQLSKISTKPRRISNLKPQISNSISFGHLPKDG